MNCYSCGRRPHDPCPRQDGCPYVDHPSLAKLITFWQARATWLHTTATRSYQDGRDGEAIWAETRAELYEQVVKELRQAINSERAR